MINNKITLKRAIIILIVILFAVYVQATKQGNNNEQVNHKVETKSIYEGNFSEKPFQAILQQLQINSDDCYLPFVVEEILRCNNSLSIWVVPTIIPKDTGEHDSLSFACYVLLADRQTGEIVSKHYNSHAWESSDAWRFTKILIDDRTCESYINHINTYSVIVCFEDSNRISSAMKAEISLFIQQNNSLHEVLSYTTDTYKIDGDDCEESLFFEKNLFISNRITNGLYDIVMSMGMWIDDDDTDYTIFRFTGNKYEETTKPDSVVYAEYIRQTACTGTEYLKVYLCFGKTMAQAYNIWKENAGYDESYFLTGLPEKDMKYVVAGAGCCPDVDLEIRYRYDKNKLLIFVSDGHFSTSVEIIEKGEYTQITSISSD